MTTINEYLLHRSSIERIAGLSTYLNKIAELHNKRQFASIEITPNPTDNFTFTVPEIKKNANTVTDLFSNLIDCLSHLYPRYDRYLSEAWNSYQVDNNKQQSLKSIESLVYKKRKIRENKLDACFCNNDIFLAEKSTRLFQVIQKKHDSAELREILSNPDKAITDSELIKNCAATTVSLYTMRDGRKIIIKRHNNHKGVIYNFLRNLIDSRARVCWRGALLLKQIGINTPENLAMLEIKKYTYVKKSYIITEYAAGPDLSTYFIDDQHKEKWELIIQQAEDILVTFPQVRVAHGDFKSTNFIIENDTLSLIDLDSFNSFYFNFIFKENYQKDIDRFQKNWIKTPSVKAVFQPIINNVRKSMIT